MISLQSYNKCSFETHYEIHLIDVFSKNEKENLSQRERNEIKKLVEFIKKNG